MIQQQYEMRLIKPYSVSFSKVGDKRFIIKNEQCQGISFLECEDTYHILNTVHVRHHWCMSPSSCEMTYSWENFQIKFKRSSLCGWCMEYPSPPPGSSHFPRADVSQRGAERWILHQASVVSKSVLFHLIVIIWNASWLIFKMSGKSFIVHFRALKREAAACKVIFILNISVLYLHFAKKYCSYLQLSTLWGIKWN